MHPPIEYLLFDLDNTLYSSRWGLEAAVSRRINGYLAARLGLPLEEARALRRERIETGRYGTTLEWLRAEKGFDDADTEEYLARIHPEDEADALEADPALRSLLLSFSQPLGILTNSPREHALRVLEKLGVLDLFPLPSIFDIRRNGFKGKPRDDVFRGVLDTLGVEAAACLLVDDVARYVEGYRAIGGAGVYYDETGERPGVPGPRITALEELIPLTGGCSTAGVCSTAGGV
ncbi:MAG: HAD-IA family hydrolase [Treponema sp.]|jgi:putative hydrolase of the HAD superfamily|nr:HAD-IA family hydrolase [Treponema sp.]